jgi:hypothetical protein
MGAVLPWEVYLHVRYAVLSPAILCQRGLLRIHACTFFAGFLLKPLSRTACPVFPPLIPWYSYALQCALNGALRTTSNLSSYKETVS